MIDVTLRRAADAWFLDRGLPAVLRPGALVRRLWPRSAPALAGFAVFMANSALLVAITGKHTIDIDGHPTRTEWFVLALLVLVLPIAVLVGWLVSRISTVRGKSVAATVAMTIAATTTVTTTTATIATTGIAATIVGTIIVTTTATTIATTRS